jgi:hypothetical protein
MINKLNARFEKNTNLHSKIKWEEVENKLSKNPAKMKAVVWMEETGGEPAVIGMDEKTGEILIADCSVESPSGRRSWCYDKEAWVARKENKPKSNAVEEAAKVGIELMTEDEYRKLQSNVKLDLKSSSWLKTPDAIRKLGGAIFADRRYDCVFVYHNGADSYYAARGFRGVLRV